MMKCALFFFFFCLIMVFGTSKSTLNGDTPRGVAGEKVLETCPQREPFWRGGSSGLLPEGQRCQEHFDWSGRVYLKACNELSGVSPILGI